MSDSPLPPPKPITADSPPWHIFHHLWTQAAYLPGLGDPDPAVYRNAIERQRYQKELWQALEHFIPVPVDEAPPLAAGDTVTVEDTEPKDTTADWRDRQTMRAESLRTAIKMLLNHLEFFKSLPEEAHIALEHYIEIMFAPPDFPPGPIVMPVRPVDAEFPDGQTIGGAYLIDNPRGRGKLLKLYNYETILREFQELDAGIDSDGKLKVWVTFVAEGYLTIFEDEAAREFLKLLAARGLDYARQVLEQKPSL